MEHSYALITRSLARLGLVMVLAFIGLASYQATAYAQAVADPDFWKQTAEHRNTVNRFVYSQSPQTIPAGYDAVREAEEILRQQQRTLPPSNPQAPSLWRQIRTLPVKAAVSTAPRALGTIGLAAGTFELGWKIGTGINAKFLRIGIPEGREAGVFYSYVRWYRLEWKSANSSNLAGAQWPETEGWVGSFVNFWGNVDNRWFDAPCQYSGIAPPVPLITKGPLTTTTVCGVPGQPDAPVRVRYAFLPEHELAAQGPIEDYTNQPVTRSSPAPTPPPQTTVEQAIETELDKPENELLRQWLNYQIGSPNETDPTGSGHNDRRLSSHGGSGTGRTTITSSLTHTTTPWSIGAMPLRS